MALTGAQLVAKVAVEGDAEAKAKLQNVDEKVKGTSSGFKSFLGNALSMAGGFAVANIAGNAIGFLSSQIGDMFQQSMDAQAGLAQTNQVIASTKGVAGETAQAVLDLATKYSHLTKFSDDTVQSASNMLLTFTNIGKNVFPMATKTVLDMSQALGQDTKNSAIQLGKALNDPLTGITALQRVGVTFTQGQKDSIKAMMQHGDIAKAQGVILKELQTEFGGSAEAAGKTFPGQLKILGQSFDDLKQNVGDAVIPILQKLVGWVTSTAVPALGRFSDWFGTNAAPALGRFKDAVVGLVTAGVGLVNWFINVKGPGEILRDLMIGIGAAILAIKIGMFISTIPALVASFLAWAVAAGTAAIATLAAAAPFLIIGAVVAVVVAGVILAIQHWGQITQWLGDVWKTVSTHVGEAFSWLGTKVHDIVSGIIGWFNNLAGIFKVLLGVALIVFAPIVALIAGVILAVTHWGAIMQWFGGVFSGIGSFIHLIISSIGDAFSGLGTKIRGVWDGVVGAIKGAINGVIGVINTFIRFIDSIQIHIPSIGVGPLSTPAIDWNGLGIGQIPYLAKGGLITSPGLAMLHAGEMVVPPRLGAGVSPSSSPSSGGMTQVNLQINGYTFARLMLPSLVQAIRTNVGVTNL